MLLQVIKTVDASHLLYRNYHVAREINKDNLEDEDLLVNYTVYLFMNSVIANLKAGDQKHLYLFDPKSSTAMKKELDENYKSNRVANPLVIRAKLLIIKILNSLGLLVLEVDGLEADDVACWLSKKVLNPLIFITEDKDWYSYIVGSNILIRPILKKTITFTDLLKAYSPIIDQILEGTQIKDYHLTLEQLVHKLLSEKKAILGDGSDNIKGFDGIGNTTAKKILVKLNKLEKYEDYVGKTKAEKGFAAGIERFKNNLKVLGYGHIDALDLRPNFEELDKPTPSLNELVNIIIEVSEEINSMSIKSRAESIAELIFNNNLNKLDLRYK